MVAWFIRRWQVEVPCDAGRRHLGWATQRQWSAQALARTTPALFGLVSRVGLMADRLTAGRKLVPQSTRWPQKDEATFAAVRAYVRRALWAEKYVDKSLAQTDQVILSQTVWDTLIDQLAAAG
jgi:hypothetical protein